MTKPTTHSSQPLPIRYSPSPVPPPASPRDPRRLSRPFLPLPAPAPAPQATLCAPRPLRHLHWRIPAHPLLPAGGYRPGLEAQPRHLPHGHRTGTSSIRAPPLRSRIKPSSPHPPTLSHLSSLLYPPHNPFSDPLTFLLLSPYPPYPTLPRARASPADSSSPDSSGRTTGGAPRSSLWAHPRSSSPPSC